MSRKWFISTRFACILRAVYANIYRFLGGDIDVYQLQPSSLTKGNISHVISQPFHAPFRRSTGMPTFFGRSLFFSLEWFGLFWLFAECYINNRNPERQLIIADRRERAHDFCLALFFWSSDMRDSLTSFDESGLTVIPLFAFSLNPRLTEFEIDCVSDFVVIPDAHW